MNKDIKLIVVDLDGTLLTSEKNISQFTIETLKKCRDKGILTAIATARPIRVVDDEYLNAIKPVVRIYHNGAVTYHGDTAANSFLIESQRVNSIVERVKNNYPNVQLACEINDVLYANFDTGIVWSGAEYIYSDFSKPITESAEKVIVNMEDNSDFIENVGNFISDNEYVAIADSQLALIMDKQASKHGALADIIGKLNISAENVVCFGDDEPDIGMIEYCGIGVAMENAKDSVKAAADEICKTNNEDGVAMWLYENVLKD